MSTKVKVKSRLLPQDLERWGDEEIARFFDENDPLELLDETEPVEVDISGSTMTQVNFRLPANALSAIKQLAKHSGLSHTTLIRLWVMEKLYECLKEAQKA